MRWNGTIAFFLLIFILVFNSFAKYLVLHDGKKKKKQTTSLSGFASKIFGKDELDGADNNGLNGN